MGRAARGVRGIPLQENQSVVSVIIAGQTDAQTTVLTATANGYGKRTPLSDYPKHKRGGQGVISIQVTERNGVVVAACLTSDEDEVMLITDGGTLIRTRAKEVSVVGRNTQGVRLINLSSEEKLVGCQRVAEIESKTV